jgi:aryl-alcohol dehydrogenase-like predicted oxidoreductase
MRKRKLGWTDLEITAVGLGTWAMGGSWQWGWGAQDDRESIATIHKAMDSGLNWIDTAPVYGHGRSEEVVGRALKEMKDKPIVATKLGLCWNGGTKQFGRLKAASVRQECEDSLRRLGVDVIDLYQIHWPNPDEDIEEGFEAMARLKDEGKVRYIAVSNFSVEQMERVGKIARVASLQPPYSMLNRGVEKEVLPYCASHEIGVVAYSPMAKGLLTGKVTKEWVASLPDDDHRKKGREFNEPQLSANSNLVDGLRGIAESRGHTPARLAVAWVLRRSEVASAIVGARRPSQIEETAPAGDWEMCAEDLEAVEKLLEERTEAL